LAYFYNYNTALGFCCHWINYISANKRFSAFKQSTLTSYFSRNTVTEQCYSVWSTLYITISIFKLYIQSKYMYKSITICVITNFTYPTKFSYLNRSWIKMAQSCLYNGGPTVHSPRILPARLPEPKVAIIYIFKTS